MHHAPQPRSTPPCGVHGLLLPWHAEGESPQERETDWFPELHFEMEHADEADEAARAAQRCS
jgi:hypothetical protein